MNCYNKKSKINNALSYRIGIPNFLTSPNDYILWLHEQSSLQAHPEQEYSTYFLSEARLCASDPVSCSFKMA